MMRALASFTVASALFFALPAGAGSGKAAKKAGSAKGAGKTVPAKASPSRKALPPPADEPSGSYALDTRAMRTYAEALTRMDAKMRAEMILSTHPTLVFEPGGRGQKWIEMPPADASTPAGEPTPPPRESSPFRWSQKGGRLSLTQGTTDKLWMTCAAEGEKLRCDEAGLTLVYLKK